MFTNLKAAFQFAKKWKEVEEPDMEPVNTTGVSSIATWKLPESDDTHGFMLRIYKHNVLSTAPDPVRTNWI